MKKSFWSIFQSKILRFHHMWFVVCVLRGSVISTGRRRCRRSTAATWWRWRASERSPTTPRGPSPSGTPTPKRSDKQPIRSKSDWNNSAVRNERRKFFCFISTILVQWMCYYKDLFRFGEKIVKMQRFSLVAMLVAMDWITETTQRAHLNRCVFIWAVIICTFFVLSVKKNKDFRAQINS